jgi:GTP-binding protein HflX
VYVANQLFATLDTTLRRVHVANAESIVLSDTVGFIRPSARSCRRIPRDAVEAADADLLLHVIDASVDNRDEQIEAVDALLVEIGAAEVPRSASTTMRHHRNADGRRARCLW